MFPSIEILTIGAGGGSIAWIDDAGALRNGPQSAGADPGPACYGRGGADPTNTDANLVLGRLGSQLAGGAMTLDADAARAAIRRTVADPLEMEVTEAASAIVEVANANMADAVRLISIGRGYDPRDFALVVFGGAGALHGAALAKELSIPRVIVPPNPGITSALGCLLVDIRHDLSTMFLRAADSVDAGEVEGEFHKLEAEARKLLEAERVPAEQMTLVRTISMRYVGQWRSLSVEVGAELSSLDTAIARFNEEHQREFSYSREDAPVEIYQLSVRAVGITPKPKLSRAASGDSAAPEAIATRRVYFDDTRSAIDSPVYERSMLRARASITGPAILEQLDSTVLVPPGVRAEVDEWQIIHMHISEP
jgi:N-methylhydantoinase A